MTMTIMMTSSCIDVAENLVLECTCNGSCELANTLALTEDDKQMPVTI